MYFLQGKVFTATNNTRKEEENGGHVERRPAATPATSWRVLFGGAHPYILLLSLTPFALSCHPWNLSIYHSCKYPPPKFPPFSLVPPFPSLFHYSFWWSWSVSIWIWICCRYHLYLYMFFFFLFSFLVFGFGWRILIVLASF